MSDKTDTQARRLRQDSPTVDAVCRQIRRLVPPDRADLAADFAEIFLAKASPEFLRERSIDTLAHLTQGAFEFLDRSEGPALDVQIVNPDIESEGWYAPVTVIRTNISERPFVVDTIREYLHAEELAIEHLVYPVLLVERDANGSVVGVGTGGEREQRESLVHCEVGLVTDAKLREHLRKELRRRLLDVEAATDDFPAMLARVDEVSAELARVAERRKEMRLDLEEIQAFLRWLRDGGFVFLGYRAYDILGEGDGDDRTIQVEAGSGLGVLRKESDSTYASPVPMSSLEPGMREIVESGPVLMVSKANSEATIHRRVRMDYIGVKKMDEAGRVIGEHRFLGLFTSRAYGEDAANIPILRWKLRQILEQSSAGEGTHDYKEIITIFNSLPKEELFLTSAEEVGEDIRTVLTSYHTSSIRVTLRPDPLQRGLAVMVILPKDKFSGEARRAIEASLVETLAAEVLNYHLTLGGGDQARLHFYLAAPAQRIREVKAEQVEQIVAQLTRTWADRVREGLERVRPPDEARRLARRYAASLSPEYQAATDALDAVEDILELEAMRADGRAISISFSNRGVDEVGGDGVTELKVYVRQERLILSDFMPILENMGLRVIEVNPFEARGEEIGRVTLYAFAVQDGDGRPLDIEDRGALLAEALLAVRAGDALNDTLNRLVLGAGLHWREVDVLRAYAGYAFQVGAVPSRLALPSALVRYPGLARELFELFQTRFDPKAHASIEDREGVATDIREAFHASLRSVTSLTDDRVLRRLEELIAGTLRTNYFKHGGRAPTFRSGGVPYISFKFSCPDVDILRRTRLRFEVWVHSARMEGVHLRGASVARGGIRWSDRPDDFRTEILGLVKTQVVKNAVIVPGGSKGGFVCRTQIDDPEARFEEGRAQYRTLMRGLLDLTDNLDASGEGLSPEGVVSWDAPDPYLVVAADKGTATFSDMANALSAEYGFWLDDAFASGGSNGYDHKAVGITARGGWECVKRHFREKGKDIQSEPFTVVGIGDMSGDVFGNGMLLSEQIRLVAAFDHRHIFVDPDPDVATSFAERKRVFELGRSSWADYDASLLSEGGMIVPRGTKEVELTPQARAALGIPGDAPAVMDGESLIRAVLCAPVELLWNGGIGTYVKSTRESDSDAGDPSNDAVRVNAPDLRCEVVGEGGNLGLTQRARIEYALRGGRINTDALDNSGGVDMSDHEVNLKILFAPCVQTGEMTADDRNALLEELTEPVAELVLDNNRSQSLGISLDVLRTKEGTDDFRDLMFSLEKTGELDRAAEFLPSLDQMEERREQGLSLARPELCVLLAYAKLALKTRLLKGTLPDDPITDPYLNGYFPVKAVHAAGKERLRSHRLRREIVVCQLTNDLVGLMGATFVSRVMRDTGRGAEDVVRAWLVASRLSGHRTIVKEMGAQQSAMNSRVAYRWLLGLSRVLERTTRWVLQNVEAGTSTTAAVDQNLGPLQTLRGGFADIVAGEDAALFTARVREIREVGADEHFSRSLITLRFLDQLLDVVDIARETGAPEIEAGRAYYEISEMFEIPWLRRVAFAAAGDEHWDQRAAQLLTEDLARAHRRIVVSVLRSHSAGEAGGATRRLVERRAPDVARFQDVAAELKAETQPGLAAASVVVRELSALADRLSR